MKILDTYPVVVVPRHRLAACRDFYHRLFGMAVLFDSTWFCGLGEPGSERFAIALMSHDHPTSPPGPQVFAGEGVFITVQVEDCEAALASAERQGVAPVYPLAAEPWGQRRFSLRDPAGVLVDVVEQIEPAPGYWQPYR